MHSRSSLGGGGGGGLGRRIPGLIEKDGGVCAWSVTPAQEGLEKGGKREYPAWSFDLGGREDRALSSHSGVVAGRGTTPRGGEKRRNGRARHSPLCRR